MARESGPEKGKVPTKGAFVPEKGERVQGEKR